MKDAADEGHQQDDEREERKDGISRNREGEGMNFGPHQIFQGGKDQALGRARRAAYGTLPYGVGLGKRRNGWMGHGTVHRSRGGRERQKPQFSRRLPSYFFISVKVIRILGFIALEQV